MAYIGKQPVVGNFQKCDAITVVNGQAAYTMQVGGVNVNPESENHMLVSLNGVLQAPVDSFTISGSTITFASNLATGDVIDFIMLLGNVLDLGTPSDNTVTAAKIGANAVTNAKLNNDIISGATELASEPADTDEFLVSDAGVLKRIDYSLIKGGGSYELLATTTISSGVSSVSFDGYFSSTYDRYLVTFNNLMFSTDDIHLYIRVRQSNTDRTDSSGYRNMAVGSYCEFDGSANANNEIHFGSIDTRGRITVNTVENTDVYGGISGHLEIIDPLQTSYEKVIFTRYSSVRTNDNNG